ncbi:hypothetical protein BH23ACI1_BH23ACI1_24710 [soil metagenome]
MAYATMERQQHSEGAVARTIEDQTAKLPSDAFLWMAVGAMATSATLQVMGQRHVSLFIGQWAPTFLIFGLYNKLVKQLGSDRIHTSRSNPAGVEVRSRHTWTGISPPHRPGDPLTGSHTRNVAPWPGPALSADTVPP